jgi:FkbM family methyltransferase
MRHCTVRDGYSISIPDSLDRVFNQYEKKSSEMVVSKLGIGDVFVDVGANFGFYSVLARSMVGESGLIIAIEPSPETVAVLKGNVLPYENIKVFETAVAEVSGEVSFFHTSDFVNSGIAENPPFIRHENVKKITVRSASLDEILIDQANLCSIDFLKIDVQGEDIAVLNSGKKIIESSKGLRLLIEWAPTWMRNIGVDPMSLPSILLDHGFEDLVCIDDRSGALMSVEDFQARVVSDSTGKIYCNVFATKK